MASLLKDTEVKLAEKETLMKDKEELKQAE